MSKEKLGEMMDQLGLTPDWEFENHEIVEYVGERTELSGEYEVCRFMGSSALNPFENHNSYLLFNKNENPENWFEALRMEIQAEVKEYELASTGKIRYE